MKKTSIFLIIFSACIVLLSLTLISKTDYLQEEGINSIENDSKQKKEIVLPSPEIVLGQNFIVGIPNKKIDSETKKFLSQIKPAGIILYYRNYQTPNQLKHLISELQELGKKTTGHSYFIMIDEEPGGATRLNLFKNVFDTGSPEWDQIERDIKEMKRLGINVDLAPLADFPFNEDTFIKRRIPAHNPEALVDFNREFISLLQQNSISATLKHFPGMGVFVDDPHKTLPHVSTNQEIINGSIKIFKDGIINADVDFVMTGHAVYDNIDPNTPATLSKKITTDILRNELNFEGLIITDDLSDMPFIIGKEKNLLEATARSIEAGHNLVIFSHRSKKTLEIFNSLLKEMESDEELRCIIEDNYKKVVLFKESNIKN